ncbi:MAG TPA: Tol-Pal system beta propeller repeat protein TolB [Thermoanaerobaculia bacterium]|jgi:TolB protein|nr:Tol-Pal system beta propeller repeat protein TolB [Thermoanaerobaculia bacterium]
MRPRNVALTVLSCLLLLALVLAAQQPPAPAPPPDEQQPPQVTLELNRGGQARKIKLAFPAFRGPGQMAGDAGKAGRELEETVRRDLDLSGYFEIQGPDVLSGLALTGDVQQDLAAYRSTGNEVLLLGDVRTEGDRIVFEGRVLDLGSGQAVLAKRYKGPFTVSRRMAHTFADEVIRFLTGKVGIALSSIAFSSDRTGNKEIYVMDYDGADQRRITGHRSTSMSPAWSPGGGALAYTSFFNGPPGIYFADLASGKKRPVVASGSLNTSPSFSPDGRRIAFARSLDGNIEIFLADADGGGLRRLTNSNAIDTNPAWSPKGGEIAFTSSRAGNPHLYLMDAEGANQRRLTFDGAYNDGAAWSPDGDLVAYTSRREGAFQIAVTNVGTLETAVLTSGPGENESPTFSPDGRKIAFTSRRSGRKQIYVMDLDGGNLRQITTEGNNDLADWSRSVPEK